MPNFPDTRISLILRLAKPNDLLAWQEFTEIYAPAIYRIAKRRGMQSADAEDIAQETLFAVARAIERFEPDRGKAKFRTWLTRIARNIIADFCTSKLKRPLTQVVSDSWTPLSCSKNGTPEEAIEMEFAMEYRSALFQLAARRIQSRVTSITWRAFHDTAIEMRQAETVAKEIGMSLGNLYVARCRVLKLLREEVQELERKFSIENDGQVALGEPTSLDQPLCNQTSSLNRASEFYPSQAVSPFEKPLNIKSIERGAR